MKNYLSLIALWMVGVSLSFSAHSHHSAATHFDLSKSITVEGVVTKFQLVSPHARLYFDVQGESGSTVSWLAVGEAHTVLMRRGWKRDTLKPGDVIKITGRPSRNGSSTMEWRTITLPDGKELFGGNVQKNETSPQKESLYKKLQEKRRMERAQEKK